MVTLRDKVKLLDFISKAVKSQNLQIISVDGWYGCGKTHLAEYLANKLNMFHINLDDKRYLIQNKGTYVKNIRKKILKQDLSKNLDNNKVVILDGICILKILENIKVKSDLKIYIKKLRWGNYWHVGEKLDYCRNVEEVIQEEKQQQKIFNKSNSQKDDNEYNSSEATEILFHEEILRYHYKFKPNIKSDVIFERVENKV